MLLPASRAGGTGHRNPVPALLVLCCSRGIHKSSGMSSVITSGGGGVNVRRGLTRGAAGSGTVRSLQSHTHQMFVSFLCSEICLCSLFCSMEWEVAPKPLSPPLWTPECIRPRLPMKMKMRMKSHPLLVGGNVTISDPFEPLRFHLLLCLYPCAFRFPSNSFSPSPVKYPQKER